jgi:hypothetical protein
VSLATLKLAVGRAAIGDALRASKGNISRAAAALGTARETLSRTLRHDPAAWPADVPRRGAGRPRKAAVTDDALRAAVVAAGPARGRWSRVGAALGLRPATARSRAVALGL